MDILQQILNEIDIKINIRIDNAELIKKNFSYESMEVGFLTIM